MTCFNYVGKRIFFQENKIKIMREQKMLSFIEKQLSFFLLK